MQDTLAHHLGRPLVVNQDWGKANVQDVAKATKQGKAQLGSNTRPEHDAISFYLLNHAFSVIRSKYDVDEPLGDVAELVDEYFTFNATAVKRAFYYLLLICTRESRHVKGGSTFNLKLKKNYGDTIASFNSAINGSGSNGAVEHFISQPPDTQLGQYTEALQFIFYQGNFNGGYGGKAWGAIADCLHRFVVGETSAEIMMDTIWTLCHNNGPIFNKGMLYTGYSNELVTILDVQRSGQIPNLVADHVRGIHYVSSELITQQHASMLERMNSLVGGFDGFTDWFLVEELGSVKKYSAHKQKQMQQYGESEEYKKAKAENEAKAKAKIEASVKAQAEEAKKWYFVTPTEKVKKITREELEHA